MVTGLEVFADAFEGLGDQYVLIGGAAADVWFRQAALEFRATKDLDLVLCVDVLGADFTERFWSFIERGGYRIKERADGTPIKYRFAKPTDSNHPSMLELFARSPLELPPDQTIVPVPLEDPHSNLSAILLDEDYSKVVMACRAPVERLSCLTPEGLILLKARAWLDLTSKKQLGGTADSRHIKKHRNDVFRLTMLLEAGSSPPLPPSVLQDLGRFLSTIEEHPKALPAIEAACRSLPMSDPRELIDILRSHFVLPARS